MIKVSKKNRYELDKIVSNFISGLFINENYKDVVRIRREFVIQFIDRFIVSYDKDNKEVIFERIEFAYLI